MKVGQNISFVFWAMEFQEKMLLRCTVNKWEENAIRIINVNEFWLICINQKNESSTEKEIKCHFVFLQMEIILKEIIFLNKLQMESGLNGIANVQPVRDIKKTKPRIHQFMNLKYCKNASEPFKTPL